MVASDLIQAAVGINLILLVIFQLVVGKVLKLMWPLFYTIQLLLALGAFKTEFP